MFIFNLIDSILLKRKKNFLMRMATVSQNQDEKFCKKGSSINLADGSSAKDIIIGDNVWMWGTLNSQNGGKIIIGNYAKIGERNVINAVESITIGNYTAMAEDVHVTDNNNHPVNPLYRKYMRMCRDMEPRYWRHSAHSPVLIGENCWIGRNVSIMKGVCIGDNTVIAANSVVTKSIPANCIAAGNPAKVVKTNIEEITAPSTCEGFNKYINSI